MAIKVITKTEPVKPTPSPQSPSPLRIPAITGVPVRTPNIIIRAIKIMLMDIRMLIQPKQTKEELEKYSQFSDLIYRRR